MEIALVSIGSIVLGATLQYFFTKHLENQRHLRSLKTDAYVDFLKFLADATHRPSSEKEAVARLTDSKARICLYGSQHVIKTLSEFYRLGGAVITEAQRDSFVKVVAAMRSDLSGAKAIDSIELSLVLLRKREPDSQNVP